MENFEITSQSLASAEEVIPAGKPVYMLNLLRFRTHARYKAGFDAEPCSGREAFTDRYRPGFRRLATGKPVSQLFSGRLLATLIGPEVEGWDDAALNEYGDFSVFRSIVDTEVYQLEIAPHRYAALEDFRLFVFVKGS